MKITEFMNELKMEIPSDGNMGIPRSKMPQIKSRDYPEFVDYLSSNGATFSKETVPASSLKPVQNEFSKAGVLKAMQKELDGVGDKPIIASSDDYIMDGHHRWLVAINGGKGGMVNIFRVSLPGKELLDLLLAFPKVYFKNITQESAGVGKITKQNTTPDVKPGETERQAKKFFGGNGKPKPLGIKGATPNQAFNLGITEDADSMPHLYLDMDGVQADFFSQWAKWHGEKTGQKVGSYRDIGDAEAQLASIIDMSNQGTEFVENFFATLDPLKGFAPILNWIKKNNIPYSILSAPLRGNHKASIAGKKTWLSKHNPGAREEIFTGTKEKYAMAGGQPNVLIDDHGKYIKRWQDQGGIAIKHTDRNPQSTIAALEKIYSTQVEENISVTGTERGKLARKKNLRPGSEAWFKHWFSLPLMKRESFEEAKKELQQHLTGLIESTIIKEELVTEETLDVAGIITPSIKKLDTVFKKNKYEIRIVGGAVRDIALGKAPKDIDMATDATPNEMIAMLDREDIKHIPTGIEHGTITAVVDGEDFEITTLRADSNTDGRRAEVEFVRSWEEDAKRRDLTYNAMSMDIDGQIYDYHNGMDDLQDKVSKFVGDPAERIQEDYLRILRYFRFQGRMENPTWDKDTVSAVADNVSGLSKISVERVWMEMEKILSGKNVAGILQYIKSTGVADVIGLTVDNLNNIQDDTDPIIQLAKLGNPAEIAKRWKMTNINASMLEFLVTHKDQKLDKKQIEDMIADGVDKEKIAALATLQGNANMASHATSASVPDFPVTGKDLIAKGMKPGLELGQKLAQLKTKWKQSNFKATKDDLLNEDLGTPVDWEFIVAVALAAKMTPFAVKAMWKTAKGAYKIKKFADKMGIKMSKAVMGEDVSRNDVLVKFKTNQRERYMDAMLGAMHKLVQSKGKRHDISNYAFEIAKSFNFNPRQLEKLYREKYSVAENFADGKVKGKSRPGRVKRAGASCNGSVTELRKKAKNASGEKAKMYHWCANMKSGKK